MVTRSGLEESWHLGAAAVVNARGRLVASIGNPGVETFLRSAAKPFQALPLVAAGGVERYALDDADLALVCASHGGTPAHTAAAQKLLTRGGFSVADLQCGAHAPFDGPSAAALTSRGEAPSPLHNNCSGKHAGMLLACRLLDMPAADYLRRDHPLQRLCLQQVAAFCACPAAEIGIGVDGCSAPCYRLPLAAAARGYAALADPARAGVEARAAAAAARIVEAMTAAPEMVAGPGRFTTRLMAATRGRILGKEGAEGFYAVAVRGPVTLGVALKIADGGERARDGVVLDILRQLGALSAAELAALRPFHRPRLHNHRGLEVGEVVADLELEQRGPIEDDD